MKLKKKVLIVALSVVALGFVGVASAHTYNNSIAGSALANRHDVIQTSCFSWSAAGANGAHNSAPVGEVNGAAQRFAAWLSARSAANITIQAFPNSSGATALGTALNTPVYATQYSPGVYAVPNNGIYFVKINRPPISAAATTFTVTFDCTTAAGIGAPHTGTGVNFGGDLPNDIPSADFRVIVNQ